MTTHRPYRSWCKFCVMGRGVNAPRGRSNAQDDLDGVPHVSMDFGFLGFRRDRQWGKSVRWDHRTCGGACGWPGQNTEGSAGTSHWDKSPGRRKDTTLPWRLPVPSFAFCLGCRFLITRWIGFASCAHLSSRSLSPCVHTLHNTNSYYHF